ncbi:MAG: tetratricopeptide repeat protein [Bacteroidota bacterium]
MKKYLTLILIILTTALQAQITDKLQNAFASSYAHENKKDYSAAINELVSFYNTESYEINVRLGWLSYYAGDYPKSMEYYKVAMELMPYSIEAKLGYVLPLSGMGNWDEIINIYHQILKADPNNTLVNYRLGAIYYERAEYEKAKNHTEKVVNMYPFDYDSVVLLAWINLKMEDYRKAKILFNKSLLIYPENESAIEGLKLIQ